MVLNSSVPFVSVPENGWIYVSSPSAISVRRRLPSDSACITLPLVIYRRLRRMPRGLPPRRFTMDGVVIKRETIRKSVGHFRGTSWRECLLRC